jgi:hypothetical protein
MVLGAETFGGAAAAGAGAGVGRGSPLLSASFAFTGEGRDCSPRRCALPITALRLTPPSSSAIWLAVIPFSHIAFRLSMRSSVQAI